MAVYKDNATGTWRVIYCFTNWKGERQHPTPYGVADQRHECCGDYGPCGQGLHRSGAKGAERGWEEARAAAGVPELKLLVDAVQLSKFITRKKTAELISKLEKLTDRFEAEQLQRKVWLVIFLRESC
ncbi:hypothetical protein E1963_08250 [Extibacter muris]|uniref:Uncharacterized protein n=1 Tax=Extibacter muris TaxID=1796622 RepID=A0A4V2WSM1_9FIRM|nr:hypothetical protein E1963_08250 [Extibacter muris]